MHALSLRAAFAVLALLLTASASSQVQPEPAAATTAPAPAAAVDPLAEAIRERVDHLRYASEHDGTDHVVRGRRIVLTDIVARYYESQQFQPKWRDPARLDLLVAALADLEDDGLDPADYHIEALQSFRTDLRAATVLQPAEQADLEFLATDAMMLSLYHLYLGKVDPVQLSSQWNFSTRPVSVERGFERLSAALDSGQIRETFERARPQHVWYQRGREALRTYRAIAAAGGWSPISDGPTMKLGLDDPRVPALRYRLTVTGDLAGNLAAAGATDEPGVRRGTRSRGEALPGAARPDCGRRRRTGYARGAQRAGVRAHRPDPHQSRTRALGAARDPGRVRAGQRRRVRRRVLPRQ